jgi:hypothetical protein
MSKVFYSLVCVNKFNIMISNTSGCVVNHCAIICHNSVQEIAKKYILTHINWCIIFLFMNKFAKYLTNMCTKVYCFKELNIELCSLECGITKTSWRLRCVLCTIAQSFTTSSKSKELLARNQNNVSEWRDMYILGLLFQWAST